MKLPHALILAIIIIAFNMATMFMVGGGYIEAQRDATVLYQANVDLMKVNKVLKNTCVEWKYQLP